VATSPEQTAINPWRRVSDAHDSRRYELFMLAMPVFARLGFRGASIRELAHACHLSPAGLYHYFRSKRELATYALRSPRVGWERTYVDPAIDPLLQLRAMLELSINQVPVYMLCLRMLDEMADPAAATLKSATFRDGEQMIGRFVSAAAPAMGRAEAEETARLLIAVVVGSAMADLDQDAGSLRRRVLDVLRTKLVPEHLEEEKLAASFADWAAPNSNGSAVDSAA
jgi:AcrR family transcriptional regulator